MATLCCAAKADACARGQRRERVLMERQRVYYHGSGTVDRLGSVEKYECESATRPGYHLAHCVGELRSRCSRRRPIE